MTSTDNTLELIDELRTIGDEHGYHAAAKAADLLERHHKLAIAAGYPEGVEAAFAGMRAEIAELHAAIGRSAPM